MCKKLIFFKNSIILGFLHDMQFFCTQFFKIRDFYFQHKEQPEFEDEFTLSNYIYSFLQIQVGFI